MCYLIVDLELMRKGLLEQPDPVAAAEALARLINDIEGIVQDSEKPTPGAKRQRMYRARKRLERDVGDVDESDDGDWYSGA
jgi:hypothetical protein